MLRRTHFSLCCSSLLALSFFACGGEDAPSHLGTGGTLPATGGTSASGGTTATGGTGAAPGVTDTLIEDFEDGNTSILAHAGRSGNWYGYSEAGTVSLDPTAPGHAGSALAIAFDGVDEGWSGFGFNLKGESGKELYDAAAYTGVSFWIRADAPVSLTFAVADIVTDPDGEICTECHDHWATSVAVGTEWTLITLHWSDLMRGGWGAPTSDALVLNQLIGFAWNVEAPGTIQVLMDDIHFLADGVQSPNVTTMYEPPLGMGGMPSEAPGGLPWAEGGPASGPTPVEVHGQLKVSDGKLRGQDDQPAVLHGQAIGWDNWWPQYHNADVVNWLRQDWCVDIVRPAMGIEPDDAYLSDPQASKARMRTVVEAAIANGVYVIIDWHAHDIHEAEAVAFFSEMAEAYGSHPNVLYEVFNEPETEETWPDVKAYAETVIAAIRVHDPDNVVIVGTPEWDQRIDLVVDDPITTDPHVVYAVHFYAGTHGAWLRTRTLAAIEAGIPVFISESGGSEADGNGENDYDEWSAWFNFLEEQEVGWINWAISDKAGETVSMLRPGAPAMGGWTEADLTPTGVHVRSVLRSYGCP